MSGSLNVVEPGEAKDASELPNVVEVATADGGIVAEAHDRGGCSHVVHGRSAAGGGGEHRYPAVGGSHRRFVGIPIVDGRNAAGLIIGHRGSNLKVLQEHLREFGASVAVEGRFTASSKLTVRAGTAENLALAVRATQDHITSVLREKEQLDATIRQALDLALKPPAGRPAAVFQLTSPPSAITEDRIAYSTSLPCGPMAAAAISVPRIVYAEYGSEKKYAALTEIEAAFPHIRFWVARKLRADEPDTIPASHTYAGGRGSVTEVIPAPAPRAMVGGGGAAGGAGGSGGGGISGHHRRDLASASEDDFDRYQLVIWGPDKGSVKEAAQAALGRLTAVWKERTEGTGVATRTTSRY